MTKEIKAYLRIRRLDNREIVHSIAIHNLNQRAVERVMLGVLQNLGDDYYVGDSEVEKAQKAESGGYTTGTI